MNQFNIMKKILLFAAVCAAACMSVSCASCSNQNKKADECASEECTGALSEVVENPQLGLENLKKDADGAYILFDGTSADGWRGYGKDYLPERWSIEDGCLKLAGSGTGEGQSKEGGDIIFAQKFKNFELEVEWKVSKGGNSGIFYLAQETKEPKADGKMFPIYISCPEYQVLDNANHPDAKLGVNGNRQSASLYDMIPAVPQNQNPFGEWNKAKIMVYKGTVVHYQNDVNVLEYHLWTDKWTEMLQNSKFSQEKWPEAFELLNNCGGENHEGYVGLQDHGDDVWYRNIKVKVLD